MKIFFGYIFAVKVFFFKLPICTVTYITHIQCKQFCSRRTLMLCKIVCVICCLIPNLTLIRNSKRIWQKKNKQNYTRDSSIDEISAPKKWYTILFIILQLTLSDYLNHAPLIIQLEVYHHSNHHHSA